MGRLGIGSLADRAEELVRVGRPYADGRKVMPVLELTATIVQPHPGRDGKWRNRVSPQVVDDYLAAARKVNGILLVDIQPGRADLLDEVKSYERWLSQPDVGIALDRAPRRAHDTRAGVGLAPRNRLRGVRVAPALPRRR